MWAGRSLLDRGQGCMSQHKLTSVTMTVFRHSVDAEGVGGTLTRRDLLIAMASTAAGGCARSARPTITSTVVTFDVATVAERVRSASGGASKTYAQREAAVTAATARWFTPVLSAFNNSRRWLRARFDVLHVEKQSSLALNPSLSALIGVPWGYRTVDLTAELRVANIDANALLPGTLQAGMTENGTVWGVPIDISPYAVFYGTSGHKPTATTHIGNPRSDWSTAAFAVYCQEVAQQGGQFWLGLGQGTVANSLAWLGYVEGYGGQVATDGRISLTSSDTVRGLNAFADLLQTTWPHPLRSSTPIMVYFAPYNGTTGGPLTFAPPPNYLAMVHFPRAPMATVPANIMFAVALADGPKPEAGATFVTWLLTGPGQSALTSIGFPAMRTDITTASWLEKGPAAVDPVTLRYVPPAVQALQGLNFTGRLYSILTSPADSRVAGLQQLEQACNSVIAGGLNVYAAGAELNKAGIPAV